MDFAYYVIRKEDMVVLQGAEDVVGAINIGQRLGCDCLIMQGCVITEIEAQKEQDTADTVPSESVPVEVIE